VKEFINSMLDASRRYNILDYTFFKLSLMALGIILGVYFRDFFAGLIPAVWAVAVIGLIWVMYKTFIVYRK
jgi:prepilin signal peptidase PulO-like enzyme (type II secretory pathway)